MHTQFARRHAESNAEELGEVHHLHASFLAQHFLGTHLMHFQTRMAGRAFGGDYVGPGEFRRL